MLDTFAVALNWVYSYSVELVIFRNSTSTADCFLSTGPASFYFARPAYGAEVFWAAALVTLVPSFSTK